MVIYAELKMCYRTLSKNITRIIYVTHYNLRKNDWLEEHE